DCRDVALDALEAIGPAARDAVADVSVSLRDLDPAVRMRSARVLGDIGPAAEAAVPRLKKLLDDEDGRVRVRTACALVEITADEKAYVPLLLKALRDPADRGAREAAVDAVGRLRPLPRAAVPVLVERLGSDPEWERGAVIDVLGRAGPAAEAA